MFFAVQTAAEDRPKRQAESDKDAVCQGAAAVSRIAGSKKWKVAGGLR